MKVSKEVLLNTMHKILSNNKNVHHILIADLVETGKLTNLEVQNIIGRITDLNDLRVEVLVWIYTSLFKNIEGLYKPDYFFSKEEIDMAKFFEIPRTVVKFPLVFMNVEKLSSKEEYGFFLDAKTIVNLSHAKILKLNENMQRESISIKTPQGVIIKRINFSEKQVKSIASSYVKEEGYSSQLKFHILFNEKTDYTYNEGMRKLTINDADIYLLGGNHRIKALERALFENENISEKFSVLLTVGNIFVAREIIRQDENRQPIKKQHLKTFENTVSNSIVMALKNNKDLGELKFCTTNNDIEKGIGFIQEYSFANAIDKYYNIDNNISPKEKREIIEWLEKFFIEIIDIYYDDIKNFYKQKSDVTNPIVFNALVWLSYYLKNKENWSLELRDILSKINLNGGNILYDKSVRKPVDKLINKVKEVMK